MTHFTQPVGYSDAFGLTHPGTQPGGNTDQYLVAEAKVSLLVRQSSLDMQGSSTIFGQRRGEVFAVADGLGREPYAGRASRIAMATLNDVLLESFVGNVEERDDMAIFKDLTSVVARARARMRHEPPGHPFMATAITLAYVVWPAAYVVHVGHTRAYKFREDRIRQVTSDHTVASRFSDLGILIPRDAHRSKMAKAISNAVTSEGLECEIETRRLSLRPNDVLVLCTDGISDCVTDEGIRLECARGRSSREICEAIISAAVASDSHDDGTVIVARFPRPLPDTIVRMAAEALPSPELPRQPTEASGPEPRSPAP